MKRKKCDVSDYTQKKSCELVEPDKMADLPKPVSDPDDILCELHIEDGKEAVNLEDVDGPDDVIIATENVPVSNNEIVNIRNLPRVNCMEKIVLCIDLSKEMEESRFTLGNGQSYSGVQMVKKTLEMFIHTKHMMDSKHAFALVIVTDSIVWITDFTNNAKELCDVLKDLNETSPCNTCDLSDLFSSILEKTSLPEVINKAENAPPFVIRVIVIYGRSHMEPFIDKENQAFKKLMACDYFFFDFLYIHPLASHDNNVQVIFDNVCELDVTNSFYMLELTHRATKMHNKVASLLGHPLQRPLQTQAQHKIQSAS